MASFDGKKLLLNNVAEGIAMLSIKEEISTKDLADYTRDLVSDLAADIEKGRKRFLKVLKKAKEARRTT